MKVVQINLIADNGSTGRTMKELHDFLVSKSIDSIMIYGHGRKPKGPFEYRVVGWFGYYYHNILARLFGSQGWHSYFATKKLIRFLKKQNPDVIHLRNLHGNFLHLKLFFNYLKEFKGKIFWTTHDFWLITGMCYMCECDKWKNKCSIPCPDYKRFRFGWKKYISKNWNLRKNVLATLPNFCIQTNSKFAESVIKKSLLKDKKTYLVYNWIDTNVFRPIDLKDSKCSKPVIQVAWSILSKNSWRFQRFLDFAKEYKDKYHFRMLGLPKDFDSKDYDYVEFIPPTDSKHELAKFYSEGDVFFNTSDMDTFGKVVAESLACGTPVVVFDNGALSELIGPGCGIVLQPDVGNKDIDKAIEQVLKNDKDFYRSACRKYIVDNFSYQNNCQQLLDAYKS